MTNRAKLMMGLGMAMVTVSLLLQFAVQLIESQSASLVEEHFRLLKNEAPKGYKPPTEDFSAIDDFKLATLNNDMKSKASDMRLIISSPPLAKVKPNEDKFPSRTPTFVAAETSEVTLETLFRSGTFPASKFHTEVVSIPRRKWVSVVGFLFIPGLILLVLSRGESKKGRGSSIKGKSSSLDTVVTTIPPLAPDGLYEHDPSTPESQRYGRFVKGDFVGKGNMGEVYRCDSCLKGDKHDYALKVLLPEWSEADDFRSRFEREAKICQTLAHDNLVRAFDHGEKNGRLWMAMDYVEGQELGDWLKEKPREQKEIIEVTIGLCDGLEYAHNVDVIHRDLKPGNVLIRSSDGRPIIADFGLARGKHYATITKTNSTLGTPLYMPPEQITGGKGSPQGDLYSLGCLLYEALAGQPPFAEEDVIQLLTIKLSGVEPPEISDDRASEALRDVVKKLLANQPQNRFQSAAEVKEALASCT